MQQQKQLFREMKSSSATSKLSVAVKEIGDLLNSPIFNEAEFLEKLSNIDFQNSSEFFYGLFSCNIDRAHDVSIYDSMMSKLSWNGYVQVINSLARVKERDSLFLRLLNKEFKSGNYTGLTVYQYLAAIKKDKLFLNSIFNIYKLFKQHSEFLNKTVTAPNEFQGKTIVDFISELKLVGHWFQQLKDTTQLITCGEKAKNKIKGTLVETYIYNRLLEERRPEAIKFQPQPEELDDDLQILDVRTKPVAESKTSVAATQVQSALTTYVASSSSSQAQVLEQLSSQPKPAIFNAALTLNFPTIGEDGNIERSTFLRVKPYGESALKAIDDLCGSNLSDFAKQQRTIEIINGFHKSMHENRLSVLEQQENSLRWLNYNNNRHIFIYFLQRHQDALVLLLKPFTESQKLDLLEQVGIVCRPLKETVDQFSKKYIKQNAEGVDEELASIASGLSLEKETEKSKPKSKPDDQKTIFSHPMESSDEEEVTMLSITKVKPDNKKTSSKKEKASPQSQDKPRRKKRPTRAEQSKPGRWIVYDGVNVESTSFDHSIPDVSKVAALSSSSLPIRPQMMPMPMLASSSTTATKKRPLEEEPDRELKSQPIKPKKPKAVQNFQDIIGPDGQKIAVQLEFEPINLEELPEGFSPDSIPTIDPTTIQSQSSSIFGFLSSMQLPGAAQPTVNRVSPPIRTPLSPPALQDITLFGSFIEGAQTKEKVAQKSSSPSFSRSKG